MLKRNNQNKKLNNKGMSLVEIIVTVTILALVSGILLSAFVSVMRTSAKSRDVHRATTVAQNIMEGINLKTAQEMAYQFNYPIRKDSTGNNIDNFNVYPSTMFQFATDKSVGELYDWTDPVSLASTTYVVNTKRTLAEYEALTDAQDIANSNSAYLHDITTESYDFLRDENGKYIYYMRNIKNDGMYYNAKITLDAGNYTTSGTSGITVNDDLLVSVPTIDSTYDAVEVMSDTLDETNINKLEMNHPGLDVEEDTLYRSIVVTINNELMIGTSGQYRTTVKVDYYYCAEMAGGTTTPWIQTNSTNTVFDNVGNETEKQLRNIYLYYYPMYGSTSLVDCQDVITIKNNDNKDVEVYIIKQEPPASAGLTDAELVNKELAYKVLLNVEETSFNADGKSHVQLHTNWDENLGSIYTGLNYSQTQSGYERNGIVTTADMYNKTDIRNKKAYDRIFDVTVEVYKSEAADDLATFTASTTPADWFKEENHLITVTSSISQ